MEGIKEQIKQILKKHSDFSYGTGTLDGQNIVDITNDILKLNLIEETNKKCSSCVHFKNDDYDNKRFGDCEEIQHEIHAYNGDGAVLHERICVNEDFHCLRFKAKHISNEVCDHNYVPIGDYNQNGKFICTKCPSKI